MNINRQILVAALLAGTLALVGCGGSSQDSESGKFDKGSQAQEQVEAPEPEAAPEPEPEPEAASQSVYRVGDTLDDGGLQIVYVASGEHVEENQFLQPKDGNKYIFIKLAFINGSKADKGISIYNFECYADGYAADAYYGGDDSLSATLSSGRSTMGSIYFEVPADASEIEIEYTPTSLFSDKITFAFEGEADSGYVLEANNGRAEDAVSVGETVEGTGVAITYLSCGTWESDNMFAEPKVGYHFVSLELEFENTGSSDAIVSSFSFDCFADGAACDAVFYRDDDLSATISPGRKAKGTVTFEVPDDAEVIEVEYEDNYWTSSRITFTVQ